MEYLQCKACGCFSMLPMEVEEFNIDLNKIEESLQAILDEAELEENWDFEAAFDQDTEDGDEDDDEDDEDTLPSFLTDGDTETRFFNCHVCGDNWLSIKQVDIEGQCQIVFIHQMGATPLLKRVAQMQTPVVVNEQTVATWEYFLDEAEISEENWRDQLEHRRKILKSICTN